MKLSTQVLWHSIYVQDHLRLQLATYSIPVFVLSSPSHQSSCPRSYNTKCYRPSCICLQVGTLTENPILTPSRTLDSTTSLRTPSAHFMLFRQIINPRFQIFPHQVNTEIPILEAKNRNMQGASPSKLCHHYIKIRIEVVVRHRI